MKRKNGTAPGLGYVYAIDCGSKVKIGCSIQPEIRMHNLAVTLGLSNPACHISKLCFDHYDFENKVHAKAGRKSDTGEFFCISISDAARIIEDTFVEITKDEIDFIEAREKEVSDNIKKITGEMFGIDSLRKQEVANKRFYNVMLNDAMAWADAFGLDHIDKLRACDGSVVDLLTESLMIHKAIIKEYAKAVEQDVTT